MPQDMGAKGVTDKDWRQGVRIFCQVVYDREQVSNFGRTVGLPLPLFIACPTTDASTGAHTSKVETGNGDPKWR
jgi:hypothetical protein